MQPLIVNRKERSPVYKRASAWLKLLYPPLCPVCQDPLEFGRQERTLETPSVHPQCADFLPRLTHSCRRCAVPIPASATTRSCGPCASNPPHFERTQVPFLYQRPISDWIQQLKFNRRLSIAPILAELMVIHLVHNQVEAPQALVPVPLHRARLRRRGFNQAYELSRPLGAALGIPVRPKLLRRCRTTAEQSGLNASQRRGNVRGAFQTTQSDLPRHVALVDDVVTTTSTVNECARVLREAGVERVDVWAVARAE